VNILGLVPARGGSKGIPRKNLAPLCGRPLLAYTCEAACASSRLGRVVVSTDDAEIARVASAHGVDAPFLRPDALSGDDVPMIDVARHALAEMDSRGFAADAVVILQPTSPLRRGADIDRAVELFERGGADTVVTVVPVPHQFTPGSLMTMRDGLLAPVDSAPVLRRQDKPALYARNGPAVLVVARRVVESGRLYGDAIRGLEMEAADSTDVDTLDDLALAEFRLTRRRSGA